MTTRHEAITVALVAALAGHPSEVMREQDLPQRCPAAGILNVVPQDPVGAGTRLGAGIMEWSRAYHFELVVQGADAASRNQQLDASIAQIGAILHGATLGGAIDYLDLGPPTEADHVPMEGAASLKGAVVVATVFYETSDNPLEEQT